MIDTQIFGVMKSVWNLNTKLAISPPKKSLGWERWKNFMIDLFVTHWFKSIQDSRLIRHTGIVETLMIERNCFDYVLVKFTSEMNNLQMFNRHLTNATTIPSDYLKWL